MSCPDIIPDCPTGFVPGPQGPPGTAGAPGVGIDAFTVLGGTGFTVPAVSANVPAVVLESGWMAPGSIVFIVSAGFYQVASVTDETDIILTNLGYPGNAAPASVIAAGQQVVPSGLQGPNGAAGGGVTNVALSAPAEFTVTGTPVTTTGTLAITSAAGQAANQVYATPNGAPGPMSRRALVAADIPAHDASKITSGQIAIANGGTGQATQSAGFNALSPVTTKGDLIARSSTSNVRVSVGTNGQLLTADSTATPGVSWQDPAVALAVTRRAVISNPDVMQATDRIIGFNVAAPVSETLVSNPANGRVVILKDESGAAAAAKNITISAGAGDTLQGGGTLVISNNFGFYSLYFDATDRIWFIIGSA